MNSFTQMSRTAVPTGRVTTGRAVPRTPRTQQRSSRIVRHGLPFEAGEVNDPTKVAQRKEEKKKGVWGEPKNNNPLEKTTIAHDPELGEEAEKLGDKLEEGVKKVGDKLKEVTGQD